MTVEQMVRLLLDEAVNHGLVSLATEEWSDPSPMARSAGELLEVAELLSQFLRQARIEAQLRNSR